MFRLFLYTKIEESQVAVDKITSKTVDKYSIFLDELSIRVIITIRQSADLKDHHNFSTFIHFFHCP